MAAATAAMQHRADYSSSAHSNGLQSQFEQQEKVRNLEIVLDRSGEFGDGVFYPGETLTGHVRLELSQRLAVRSIDLLVQGMGHVAWKQRDAQGERIVSEDEVYFNDIAGLVDRQNDELVALSAGEHMFPFASDLPTNLPSSFKGTNGSISYLVKVVVQAEKDVEHLHQEPYQANCVFHVEAGLPLSDFTDMLHPLRLAHKVPVKTGSFTLGSNNVRILLLLPRRVYDTDDTIVANLELINGSRKRILNLGLALVMEATYLAKGCQHSERMVITTTEDAGFVRPGERKKWLGASLKIPGHIPPSDLPFSNVIKVKYFLVFKADAERSPTKILLQALLSVGAKIPAELKADRVPDDLPSLQSQSSAVSHPRILYSGRAEPQMGVGSVQSQRPLREPLQVDVNFGRAASEAHQQQQRLTPQQFHSTDHTDSQVISMRFTDELDDTYSPYDHSRVSRNPLFDDENDYQDNGMQQLNRDPNQVLQSAFGNGVANDTQQDFYY